MRVRGGNPLREAHGYEMRVYDWVAPPGIDAHAAILAMEGAVPGLKLFHRGDGEVHGYVTTSLRPNGARYICVVLYDTGCVDPDCPTGHRGIALRRFRPLTEPEVARLRDSVGEDVRSPLRGTNADDRILEALGFSPDDGPRRGWPA